MADVHCPHCNALNSADAPRCWNCQENLYPEQAKKEESDWLNSLRDDDSSDAPWDSDAGSPASEAPSGDSPADDTPDWLSRIRDRGQSQTGKMSIPGEEWDQASSDEQADSLPDWLQNIAADNAAPSEDDWLSVLGSSTDASDTASKPSGEAAGEPEQEEWLRNLQSWQAFQESDKPGEAPQQPSAEESAPQAGEEDFRAPAELGWLKSLSLESSEEPEEEPQGFEEETPFSAGPLASAAETPPAADDGLDWLSRLSIEDLEQDSGESPSEPAAEAPSIPPFDWTAAFEEQPSEPEEPQKPAEPQGAFLSNQDEEDWTSPVGIESQKEDEPQPVQGDIVLPTWLFSTTDDNPQPAAEEASQPAAEEASQPAAEEASQPAAEEASQPAAEEASQPAAEEPERGWGETVGAFRDQEEPAADESQPPVWSDALPDWLGSEETAPQAFLQSSEGTQPPESSEGEPQAVPDETPEEAPTAPFVGAELPDWLSEKSLEPEPAEPEDKPAFVFDETGEYAAPTEPEDHPFAEEEIPEWLASGAAADEAASTAASESAEIAPGQLPGWLEAMRPVEAATPGSASADESRTEKSGPLAGIPGTLPAEGISGQYRKPPIYSMRLHVSDKQHAHATMMEESIAEEGKPVEVRSQRKGASEVISRLVIALVLIGMLLLSGALSRATPASSSDAMFGYINFQTQVGNVGEGAPVLVAFDYQPAYSAEMRLAATGVLQELLSRGARIAAVSTTPAGPVLADELLSQAADAAGVTNKSDRIVNLGYLAGGTMALQQFAINPQEVTRYQFDSAVTGKRAWESPVLTGVTALDKFSLAVVLTDTPDVGRAWVEQVEPFFGKVPLLMITSAQAAPLMEPYVASGQVDGLVAGLLGGTYYAVPGQPQVETGYWNAFYSGVRVAIAIIVIGILLQGGLSLFKGPKA